MTLFITVHKRPSPGAAGILRLSCGQTCQSSGSASQQGRLPFNARLPQACPMGSSGRRQAGRYNEQRWPGTLRTTPPALPTRKGRHFLFIVPADIHGEIFPQRAEWRWPELPLLGLSRPVRV